MSISQNFPNLSPSLSLDFASVKKLDPRITFSRASSAVVYDGKTVAKAEENLLLYSQEFDNGWWSKYNSTIIANSTIAPDGTTTADTLTFTNTVGAVYKSSVLVGQNVVSIHAKQGTNRYIAIIVASNSTEGGFVVFDLLDGVVGQTVSGTSTTGVSGTITSLSNGFYRCAMTFTKTATANVKIELAPALSGNTLEGSGEIVGNTIGNNVFIWGAQLEQRDTVTAYQPTTTQPITNYIPTLLTAPANVARFDHNPVTGESLGLEVEEQRTNLVTYSEDFANAVYSKVNSAITSNINVAPDGTLTADSLIEDSTASALHYMTRGVTTTGAHSYSIYAKQNGRQYIVLIGYSGLVSLANGAVFDLNAGVVVSTGANLSSASITSVGNGWYRCQIVGTALLRAPQLHLMSNATTFTYTGDGYSGIFIWGAQLEAGAFPTSYIKTVASQVTRAADSASMVGSNFSEWYRQGEGTVYGEYSHVSVAGVVSASINLNALSGANQILLYGNGIVGEQMIVRANAGATSTLIASSPFSTGSFGKIAAAYKTNDLAVSANGNAPIIDLLADIPVVSQLDIGGEWNGSLKLNGHIKKIAYYPQRLTNTQLISLTS